MQHLLRFEPRPFYRAGSDAPARLLPLLLRPLLAEAVCWRVLVGTAAPDLGIVPTAARSYSQETSAGRPALWRRLCTPSNLLVLALPGWPGSSRPFHQSRAAFGRFGLWSAH